MSLTCYEEIERVGRVTRMLCEETAAVEFRLNGRTPANVVAASTVSECKRYTFHAGSHVVRPVSYWTAGQRIIPYVNSTFVWRVDTHIVSSMTYTNWRPGQPDYSSHNESCMHLLSDAFSYTWSDERCDVAACFVCEIDI